jgi:hypothetical protein
MVHSASDEADAGIFAQGGQVLDLKMHSDLCRLRTPSLRAGYEGLPLDMFDSAGQCQRPDKCSLGLRQLIQCGKRPRFASHYPMTMPTKSPVKTLIGPW